MKMLKRATVYIKRNWLKSGILFVIVMLLGAVTTSSNVMREAIIQTERNLWTQIPPIAVITEDFNGIMMYQENHGYWPSEANVFPTFEEILNVIQLPQVINYDIVTNHFFHNEHLLTYGNWRPVDLMGRSIGLLNGHGVINPDIFDIQEGFSSLIDGRTFTQKEIDSDAKVALVSAEFARMNELHVGSILPLSNLVRNVNPNEYEVKQLEVEIIGIYEVSLTLDFSQNAMMRAISEGAEPDNLKDSQTWDWFQEVFEMSRKRDEQELRNRIFLPHGVVSDAQQFAFEVHRDVFGNYHEDAVINNEQIAYFVLDSSFELAQFRTQADLLLSDFWQVQDLSGNFSRLIEGMESISWISTYITYGGLMFMIPVLGLTVFLFSHDRKREMGTYLALGIPKRKLLFQYIVELLIISVFSLGFGIYTGNRISSMSVRSLLTQELMLRVADAHSVFYPSNNLRWFDSGNMTSEQMLNVFEIGLTIQQMMALFFTGGVIIISVALISISFTLRQSPKKLLEGE